MSIVSDPPRCALCGMEESIVASHIIPKFVYRWAVATGGTGYLRWGVKPNQRVQDGEKRRWMCKACDNGVVGKLENRFAREVFFPVVRKNLPVRWHGAWLWRFCTSISWRAAKAILEDENTYSEVELSEEVRNSLVKAERRWRRWLVGEGAGRERRQNQHMIVWGELGHLDHTWPEYTHRYLLRGIERHCAWSDKHDKVFVYSKMGPVLIVGFASGEKKEGWMGTNAGRLRGRVPEENIVLTAGFADYLKDRINRASSVKGEISDQQKDKIKKTILSRSSPRGDRATH